MPHEVIASIQVLLPDDPKDMAGALASVADAWANLLAAIEPTPCTPSFAVNETRARQANSAPRRTRRGRPPRLVEQAEEAPAAELMPVA